jgi:hypothetical protein
MVVLHRQIGKLVLPRVAGRTRFTPNRDAADTQSPRLHAHLLLVKIRYRCFINAGITRLVSKVSRVRARCKAAFAVDGVCPLALLLLPRRIATRPKLGTRLCEGLALSSPSGTSRSPRLDLSRSSLAARARSRAAVAAGEPGFGVSLSCISRCHWTSSGVVEEVVTARAPHDHSVLALLIRRGERG